VSGYLLLHAALFLLLLSLLVKPCGRYMSQVMVGNPPWPVRWLLPVESLCYRLAGIDAKAGMDWRSYAVSMLMFNGLGLVFLYALLRLQFYLPLNPQHLPGLPADTAFNTAISFVSNTSWQSYAGETSLSYLSQMLGVSVQGFLSAACGIGVLMAFIRALARHQCMEVGNFWVDICRATLYILLPLSMLLSLLLVSQGVLQNLHPYQTVQGFPTSTYAAASRDTRGNPVLPAQGSAILQPKSTATQQLPMGPVASEKAINLLSGDGGGFFNANSAHPFENPTPLSNFLQMLAMLLIPAGLCYSYGDLLGDRKQGWTLFSAMLLVFLCASLAVMHEEQGGNPLLTPLGVNQQHDGWQAGGNMEGKEVRFGIAGSALFATVSTSSGDGTVNAMHDSFTPLGGAVLMGLMQTGEVIFGGPGTGLLSLIMHALLAIFVAGLMIGRAPEYLGKKIDVYEVKLLAIIILLTPLLVLGGSALSLMLPAGLAGLGNPAAHGFSEVLYAFSSAANNNGSAFAGLSANTPYYNTVLAGVMWFGRFGVLIPILAMAGSLANKQARPAGPGTLPCHGGLFLLLLLGAVVLVAALSYLPALVLGPVIEAFQMVSG